MFIHTCMYTVSEQQEVSVPKCAHSSENRRTTFSISNIWHNTTANDECRVYMTIISGHMIAALMTWYKMMNGMSFLGVSSLFCFTLSAIQTTMVRDNSYTLLHSSGFRATLHHRAGRPFIKLCETQSSITWSANFTFGGSSTFTRGRESHQHL